MEFVRLFLPFVMARNGCCYGRLIKSKFEGSALMTGTSLPFVCLTYGRACVTHVKARGLQCKMMDFCTIVMMAEVECSFSPWCG